MSVTYLTAFDYMDEIYTSDYHKYLEDESNAVMRTKVELDLLCMRAIEKQISKKPIHIHEEHSEHLWKRDKNGEIDTSAWEAGYCNGPVCTRCWHSECIYCNDEWETDPTEPCVVDRDVCPLCGSELKVGHKYCPGCGQALDWSE